MEKSLTTAILHDAIRLTFIALAVYVKAITWHSVFLLVGIDVATSFLTAIILTFSKKEA